MSEAKPLTERQQYWSSHLQACEDSGQSLKAYAQEHGLSAQALYRTKSSLRAHCLSRPSSEAALQTATFVPVGTTELKPRDERCRIHFRNGTTVELGCTPSQWPALLEAIAQLP